MPTLCESRRIFDFEHVGQRSHWPNTDNLAK